MRRRRGRLKIREINITAGRLDAGSLAPKDGESVRVVAVEGFLQALASAKPSPGGGAAAAVALALGAALVEKACSFAIGRKRYAAVDSELRSISDRARAIRARSLELAELDAKSFAKVGQALALPKETDADKERRRAALSESAVGATDVPLEIAELCQETLALAREAAAKGNPNLVDDAVGGAALARGAARICELNVHSNLKMITDAEFAARARASIARVSTLLVEADSVVERYL